MNEDRHNGGYGITIFRPGTPASAKARGIIFFLALCVVIFVQACYWLFANSVKPFVWGMPFGMFFIVIFIIIEFVLLLILYLLEEMEMTKEGGD